MPEGKPIPGVHLVKAFGGPNNPSKEDDALAGDVVDILQEGLRGGTEGGGTGGVESEFLTTLEKEEAAKTERLFFEAIAARVKERLPWANGRAGLRVVDALVEHGTRHGWRFGISDREGRPYEVEVSFSEFVEVAQRQQAATLSNFGATLDRVVDGLERERRRYFERRDAVELH